jgi:hypothetical protein
MQVKFFRGLRENYVLESHGQGIYFATDTKEILHNNEPYVGLPLNVRVEDVELNEEGSIIKWQQMKIEIRTLKTKRL